MSSSHDAGATRDDGLVTKSTPCPGPKGGDHAKVLPFKGQSTTAHREHTWKSQGSWPSRWYKCVHCGAASYCK
jgi:hypothetical protein